MLFRWTGNGAGDKTAYNDGRNWRDEADQPYDQARYPGSAANDSVLFDVPLDTGASSPVGFDGSALNVLSSFTIGPQFNGTIGSEAVPLALKVAQLRIDADMAGKVCFNSVYFADTAIPRQCIISGGQDLYLSGNYASPVISKGAGVFVDAALNNAVIGYETSSDDVTIIIGATSTASYPTQMSGTVICEGNAVSIRQYGGSWFQRANFGDYYGYGGNFSWEKGDGARIFAYGANMDASAGAAPRSVQSVITYNGSRACLDNNLGNIRILDYIELDGGTYVGSKGDRVRKVPIAIVVGTPLLSHVGNVGLNNHALCGPFDLGEYDSITAYVAVDRPGVTGIRLLANETGLDPLTTADEFPITVNVEMTEESSNGGAQLSKGCYAKDAPAGHKYFWIDAMHYDADDSTISIIPVIRRY